MPDCCLLQQIKIQNFGSRATAAKSSRSLMRDSHADRAAMRAFANPTMLYLRQRVHQKVISPPGDLNWRFIFAPVRKSPCVSTLPSSPIE